MRVIVATVAVVCLTLFCRAGFCQEAEKPEAQESKAKVVENVHNKTFKLEPFMVDGVLMGPLADISYAQGYAVIGSKIAVTVFFKESTFTVTIGKKTALVNGKKVVMPRKAILVGEKTFIPMRAAANAFGLTIELDTKGTFLKIGDITWMLNPRADRIIVDKAHQRLYHFKGLNSAYDTHTVTARKGYDTPTGIFKVTLKRTGWVKVKGKKWTGKMYYPMNVSMPGDYRIHGSKSMPKRPSSHGCMRLSVKGGKKSPARVIYDSTPVGTPVWCVTTL